MDRDQFEAHVLKAVEALPEEFKQKLENVDIVVQGWPDREQMRSVGLRSRYQLLGLYEGVPQTARSHGYTLVLPDKISIFQKPIEAVSRTTEEVVERIGEVVRHEIAHHFGLNDAALYEIEREKRRRGSTR